MAFIREHFLILVLYVHGQHLPYVTSDRSVILTTLFLGKPPAGSEQVLSEYSFAIIFFSLFLNQRKRKNGHRNIFITKHSRKNVPNVGGRSPVRLQQLIVEALATDRANASGGRD